MKRLMKGNEAIAEATLQAGCRLFFGYPITPSTEIPEYLAKKMKDVRGTCLQAESEVAAINMVYGAAAAGERVMTATSSPGFSLMQEGISYLFAVELPCVIVNVMRHGPGLGGLGASQGDYFQMTKGGGHGDYHCLVLAPASVQEMVDLVKEGFDLADLYRIPVIIAIDGILGQMMEPVEFPPYTGRQLPPKTWAARGAKGRPKLNLTSYTLTNEVGEAHALHWQQKVDVIRQAEQRYREYLMEDAEYALVAFGTCGRIAESAVDLLRGQGIKAGLLRPVTLWPFPEVGFHKRLPQIKAWMSVELNTGQMVEDVRLAVNGQAPVGFYGRLGGMTPEPEEVAEAFMRFIRGEGA